MFRSEQKITNENEKIAEVHFPFTVVIYILIQGFIDSFLTYTGKVCLDNLASLLSNGNNICKRKITWNRRVCGNLN
jgi:hypothetical protein